MSDALPPAESTRRSAPYAGPLYAVSAAIALLAAAIFFRGTDVPQFLPTANAAQPGPGGGGGGGGGGEGLYVMPGQLASSMWGVYVLDTDRQAILTYQYDAGGKQLRLLAARDFGNDLSLGDFNTFPPPSEVRRLLELERGVNAAEE